MVKLSKYELEREANIARNKAFLAQLDLKQAVDDLTDSLPTPKAKASTSTNEPQKKRIKSEPEGPRRQSTRLRAAHESPSTKRKREAEREAEEFEQNARDAEERLELEAQQHIAKRARHDDLDLTSLLPQGEGGPLPTLASVPSSSTSGRVVHSPSPYNTDFQHLRDRLQNMQLVAQNCIASERIYCATYHRDISKDLVLFGDKKGNLGVWDVRAQPEEVDEDTDTPPPMDGRVYKLDIHRSDLSSISCIKVDPNDANMFLTSSFEATVRQTSLTSQTSQEVYSAPDDRVFHSFEVGVNKELWISDGGGGLTHVDLREEKYKAVRFDLEGDKIGTVSMNPVVPHLLACATRTRTMKIWDARKLFSAIPTFSTPDSDDSMKRIISTGNIQEFMQTPNGGGALRANWKHPFSVSSAFWAPDGRKIVSTCWDNHLRVWDFRREVLHETKSFPTSRPAVSLYHRCNAGRYTTVMKAQWSPNPDVLPHFSIGSMDEKHLSIYSAKGDVLAELKDKRIEIIQAVTCSHPGIVERVATGVSSGKVYLWGPADFS